MELIRELMTESNFDNHYYDVMGPMKVYVNDKYVGTGEHVGGYGHGTSELQRMTYKEQELHDGDQIHKLVGGTFFIIGDKVKEGRITKPERRSAFEKDYGSTHTDPDMAELKKLVKDGTLDELMPGEKAIKKVKYRS